MVHAVQTLPPSLAEHGGFSAELCDFIESVPEKGSSQRPTAATLLEHPFIVTNYVPPKKEPPSGKFPTNCTSRCSKTWLHACASGVKADTRVSQAKLGDPLRGDTCRVRSSCDAPLMQCTTTNTPQQ